MDVVVYAPASIGNVGVGFDVLGAAISPIDGTLLGDRVWVKEGGSGSFELNCCGPFADKLPLKKEENIVHSCFEIFCREMEKRGLSVRHVEVVLEKNMPIGSGLGSSACSIVAALDALNQYHGNPLSETLLLTLMGEMEGCISGSLHYDNVAPAYLGGLQLILEEPENICQSIPSFDHWFWVMAYPGIEISTEKARAILPSHYDRGDLVQHGRNLAGFIHASYTHQSLLCAKMLKDVVAEPYREVLLPGFSCARQYTKEAGALATGISGSGPTLFSVCDDILVAEGVAKLLLQNYVQNENGFVHICRINKEGSRRTGTQL